MTSLLSRLLRPAPSATRLRLTVYTRAQCGCCRKALELLETYRRRYRFTIDVVDVDTDPELKARYDTVVPVVAVDGKERFRGVVNPVLFERLLRAESRGRWDVEPPAPLA
jgi:glutaredoxin